MKTNYELKRAALASLKGNWGLAIGAFFIVYLIQGAVSYLPDAASLLSLVIGGPFMLGVASFSLAYARNEEPRFEQVFDGFKEFGRALGTYILMALIVFGLTLLLIIPGIIAALSLSMTFFILADDPNISVGDALDKSHQMMKGHRWKLLGLYLSFIGWFFLSLLTLGIGFLWLAPWVKISVAHFYEDIKDMPVREIKI